MAQVTVVVPNWNRRELLEALLGRLARQTCPASEAIVVDNGSADGSAGAARKLGATVIEFAENRGFAAAVNTGIRACRTELVAVVNNDVEPESDWLERSQDALEENREAWFAAGKILDASHPDRLDGTWDLVSRGGCAWRSGHGRSNGEAWSRPRRIRFAPWTATLFRRSLFEEAGWLDERFESYLEDVEFGLTCARAGLGGVFVPQARALHRGSATLGQWHPEVVRRIARNQLLLVAKHFPERWWLRYGWPVLAGQLLWGLVALRHGAGRAWLRGKAEGVRRFGEFRRPLSAGTLEDALLESEREIFEQQKATGFDAYWRLYFALT
ncbi:MAG: glycosyltransferase family 2 protein [Acidobacteria bacterium]|nr:glycosyltransferase family 2 protein [Acidobacteriota bacterium]